MKVVQLIGSVDVTLIFPFLANTVALMAWGWIILMAYQPKCSCHWAI